MNDQFIATMAAAAKMIGAEAVKITPPAPGYGWSVQVASEDDRNMLALALERSGMKCRTASRYGRHYIFEQ